MSRTTEDRLVAALHARAELVADEDLAPLSIPDRTSRARLPRRGAVVLLAAAASAAVVTAPFLLGGGEGSEPGPVAPPSTGPSTGSPDPTPREPTPSPEPSVSPPAEALLWDRQRADVDGDGRPDEVRLLTTGSREDVGLSYLEVSLAAGGTGVAAVPEGYPPNLLPGFAVNGDGREQLMLLHTAGGDEAALLVFTWHEDRLLRAVPDGEAPLALGLDGLGRYTHYTTGPDGLTSWLRGEPVATDGPQGAVYTVRTWSWSLEGDRLVATETGRACVDAASEEPPGPCPGQPAG